MREEILGKSNHHRRKLPCHISNTFKTFLTRIFWNVTAGDFCQGVKIPLFISTLSLLRYRARFELVCVSQLFHTHYMFFQVGNGAGYLGEVGSTGRDQKTQEAEPRGAGCSLVRAMEAACVGVYRADRSETSGGQGRVGQGWASV